MNAQFPHALHNILSKRRKSENIDVPLNTSSSGGNSSHSPRSNNNEDRNSHNNNQIKSEHSPKSENLINEVDETKIKREPNVSSDQNENEIDFSNHHDLRRELLGSSKKTMNDVLKLLTNKMRGSSIKEGRKDSTEDFDGKT